MLRALRASVAPPYHMRGAGPIPANGHLPDQGNCRLRKSTDVLLGADVASVTRLPTPRAAERGLGVRVDGGAEVAQVVAADLRHRPASCAARGRRRWCGRGRASASGTARRSRPGAGRAARRRAPPAAAAAFLKVTVPAKERWAPRSRQARANAASPEKQCITHRAGRALAVDDAQDLVVGVAVVDHERLVEPLGQVEVTAERLLLGGAALGAGAEEVEPGLPHRAHVVVGLRERLDLGQRLVEPPAAASRGASLGCSATPATSASWVAAASTAHRAPGRSQPICTIRGTPTAAAAASASATGSGSSSPRAMSRWQWLSTTGCGSGSGAGGRSEGTLISRGPAASFVGGAERGRRRTSWRVMSTRIASAPPRPGPPARAPGSSGRRRRARRARSRRPRTAGCRSRRPGRWRRRGCSRPSWWAR